MTRPLEHVVNTELSATNLVRKFIQEELLPAFEASWDHPNIVRYTAINQLLTDFCKQNNVRPPIALEQVAAEISRLMAVPSALPKELKLKSMIHAELELKRIVAILARRSRDNRFR